MQKLGIDYLHDIGYNLDDYISSELVYWSPYTLKIETTNENEPLAMYIKKYTNDIYLLMYDLDYEKKEVNVMIDHNNIRGLGSRKHKKDIINFIHCYRNHTV